MDAIVTYLKLCGYDVSMGEEDQAITVSFPIGSTTIKLVHYTSEASYRPVALPAFYVLNIAEHMPLAHVALAESGDIGVICVGDHESLSINFDRPELVFEASIERHIAMLSKALADPDWNRDELLREFKANWDIVAEGSKYDLVLPPNLQCNQKFTFTVKTPIPNQKYGIDSKYIGANLQHDQGEWISKVTRSALSEKRIDAGEAIVIPLENLNPAPYRKNDVSRWYLDTINSLDEQSLISVQKAAQVRRNRFWVVFCANTPSGFTWFGINFKHKKNGKRSSLPLKVDSLKDWTVSAISVLPYSRDFIAPRGGAKLNLKDKKVLLVGCGSVGGELARQLASSGIGRIDLCDPDTYQPENLYRHCLPEYNTGYSKTLALEFQLEQQYLWADVRSYRFRLLELQDKALLESYDLIVVAIGSPTHERFFHDFLQKENVQTAVMYTWLEGYGVGGHAILDCSDSVGCLKCAYIDHSTGEYGLSSNLNFIESGQALTINHAGCGQNFLPYSSNCSMQTAIIASDLAIKYLLGRISQSSKVSWKGDKSDAITAGIHTTHRYKNFDRSLEIEPLADVSCECGVK